MILVDDRPYTDSLPADRTIRELALEVCSRGEGESRRMVVSVTCNGQHLTGEELAPVLDRSISDFADLNFRTQPVGELVRSTLDSALDMVAQAEGAAREAADLLDRAEERQAMRRLGDLFQLWQHVHQSMVFSARACGLDLEDHSTECGVRVQDLAEVMKRLLTTLMRAMKDHDAVVISDLLRYELPETLTTWRGLLSGLRDSLGAP